MIRAYVTLCLLPLSPQGVTTRRWTSRRREKYCAEYSNRWDESSVLARCARSLWAFLISFIPFFTCPCLYSGIVTCICTILSVMSNFLQFSAASFNFVFPTPQAALFLSAFSYPSSLFPLHLVEMLSYNTLSTHF